MVLRLQVVNILDTDRVVFSVGTSSFVSHLRFLCKVQSYESFFDKLFYGALGSSGIPRNQRGEVVIDYDPQLFGYVLYYLEHKTLTFSSFPSSELLEKLHAASDYFQIEGMDIAINDFEPELTPNIITILARIGNLNFVHAHLPRIQCFNLRLSCADFSHCNLKFAKFISCNLTQASFLAADLTGTHFEDCNLTDCIFQDSNFDCADKTMRRCKFKGNLANRNLQGFDFSESSFNDVDLTNTNLTNSKLDGVSLTSANLTNTNLGNSELHGVSISSANFSNTNLSDASLQNARLYQVNFVNSNLKRTNFSNSDIRELTMKNCVLNSVDFSAATFEKANLSELRIVNCLFLGAFLNQCALKNINWRDSSCINAVLKECILKGVAFSRCKLNRIKVTTTNNWEYMILVKPITILGVYRLLMQTLQRQDLKTFSQILDLQLNAPTQL